MRARLHEGPLPRYYQRKGIPREMIRGERRPWAAPVPSDRGAAQAIGSRPLPIRQAACARAGEGPPCRVQGEGSHPRPRNAKRLPARAGGRREMAAPGAWRGGREPEQRPRDEAPAP